MTQYQPPPFQPQQPYGQQYGQPQYGQPQYGQPYPPQGPYGQQPTNGMATAGFVVALIGAVLALIPFLGIVAWVISPVGLVLSIVGFTAATRRAGSGKGLAIAGIILGALGLVICFLWAIGFAAATNQPSNNGTTWSAPSYSVPSSAPTQSSAGSSAGSSVPAGSFGQGTYTVGAEIAPGRYRTDGAPAGSLFPFCMAARQSADGTSIGIPETTNNGPAYVTVRASDGLVEFTGDCTWSPAS